MVLEILVDEAVDRVFGNPGTTELPLVDRLVGEQRLRYVLGRARGAAGRDGRRVRPRHRPHLVRQPARRRRYGERADRHAQRPAFADADGGARRAAGQPTPDPGPDAVGRPRRARLRGEQVGGGGPACRRGADPAASRVPRGGHTRRPVPCSCRCRWTCSTRTSPAARHRPPGSSTPARSSTSTAAVKLLLSGRRPAVVAGDGVGRGRGGAPSWSGWPSRSARRSTTHR